MPHLWPTGSSSGWPPSITARYFSSCPSDSTSQWTPCPPDTSKQWLQVHLGCFRLSLSCPFRLLHTFSSLWPARHYPRVRILRSSFERRRDFNPHEQYAAPRTLRLLLTSPVLSHRRSPQVRCRIFPIAPSGFTVYVLMDSGLCCSRATHRPYSASLPVSCPCGR